MKSKLIPDLMRDLCSDFLAKNVTACRKRTIELAKQDIAVAWESKVVTRASFAWMSPTNKDWSIYDLRSVYYTAMQLNGPPYRNPYGRWSGGGASVPTFWVEQSIPYEGSLTVNEEEYKKFTKMIQQLKLQYELELIAKKKSQ